MQILRARINHHSTEIAIGQFDTMLFLSKTGAYITFLMTNLFLCFMEKYIDHKCFKICEIVCERKFLLDTGLQFQRQIYVIKKVHFGIFYHLRSLLNSLQVLRC